MLIFFELEQNMWDKFALDKKKISFVSKCILCDNILFWWRNEDFNPYHATNTKYAN